MAQIHLVGDRPDLAILMTAYNYGDFIERAVESALRQTAARGSYEIVVVDDGSIDDTRERLQRFAADVRLVLMPHAGVSAACNMGLTALRADHFLRLDADDELEQDAVAVFLTAIALARDAILCSDLLEVYGDGRQVYRPVDLDNLFSLEAVGIVFPTRAVREAGGYRPLFWEEHDLMIRLRPGLRAVRIPAALYRYHKHDRSMTAQRETRLRGWSELIEHWGLDVVLRCGTHPDLEHFMRKNGGGSVDASTRAPRS